MPWVDSLGNVYSAGAPGQYYMAAPPNAGGGGGNGAPMVPGQRGMPAGNANAYMVPMAGGGYDDGNTGGVVPVPPGRHHPHMHQPGQAMYAPPGAYGPAGDVYDDGSGYVYTA